MKSSLFECTHPRPVCITSGPFRKDEDGLPLPLHFLRRAFKSLDGTFPIRSVDENGPAERHEPAEKRNGDQTFLGRDAAIFREDGTQHQDIQFGLMIPDQDARSRIQVLFPLHNLKSDARREGHGEFESARGGPLRDAVFAHEAEDEGGEDAVDGAEDEGAVGGEEAGVEGGAGEGEEEGEDEEGEGGAEVEGEDAEEDEERGVHSWSWVSVRASFSFCRFVRRQEVSCAGF